MRTEMHDRLAALLVDYRATRAKLDSLVAEVNALTGEGRSSDRCVTAIVGSQGQLVDLRLDQALLDRDRIDARTLAARVLEASAAAAEEVRHALRSRLAESLPGHLQGLVGPDGGFDVSKLLPPDLTDVQRVLDGLR